MITVAQNGRTRLVMTLGGKATAAEHTAAKELADHIEKSAGIRLPVVREPFPLKGQACVAVGPEAAVAAGLPKRELRGLGDEGVLIRTLGSNLILTGGVGSSRGTLYAVYVFLEEVLGCRWWAPDGETIPQHNRLSIGRLHRRHIPPFEYREVTDAGSEDAAWGARNRYNSKTGQGAEWGGRILYKGFVHTFFALVPPKDHFRKHAEWFSEIDGVRRDNAQLCLTNPDLLQFVIDRVRAWLKESPEASIVSVSQNDGGGNCTCAACRAVEEREGSPSGLMVRFVNAVASALEDEFPRVAFDTLAYAYTRKPPRYARPRSNVIVRLCSFECNFLQPLDHASNRLFYRDWLGWKKICRRIYVWDYLTNFAHYIQPHPNWHILGDNVRLCARNHVLGYFGEGNYHSFGAEMAELRSWVLGRLLWDPRQDSEALINEFLRGYYGRAASHLSAYMRCIHTRALRVRRYPGSRAVQRVLQAKGETAALKPPGCYLDLNSPPDAPFLAPDVMMRAMDHLRAAEKAVKGCPVMLPRVRRAMLPAIYVILLRWNEMRGYSRRAGAQWRLPATRLKALREFASIFRKHRMTALGEGWSHRDLAWLRRECRKRGDVELLNLVGA